MQRLEKHLTLLLFIPLLDPAPDTSSSLFWFLLFCLCSWNSGGTMVFSSLATQPDLGLWRILLRGSNWVEWFLFAPSVNHFRTMPIVFTCRLGLVQMFLNRRQLVPFGLSAHLLPPSGCFSFGTLCVKLRGCHGQFCSAFYLCLYFSLPHLNCPLFYIFIHHIYTKLPFVLLLGQRNLEMNNWHRTFSETWNPLTTSLFVPGFSSSVTEVRLTAGL